MRTYIKFWGFLGKRFKIGPKLEGNQKTYVIGIMGTETGVGTTHLALMLANDLANVYGYRTAVVEMGKRPVYKKMFQQTVYEQGKITFYAQEANQDLSAIVCQNYHYVILDISWDSPRGVSEFVRSDQRFVVGALNRWKYDGMRCFLDRMISMKEHCAYQCLSLVCDRHLKKKIQEKYEVDIKTIPYVADPLSLEGDKLLWLEGLLKAGGLHV